MTEDGIAALAGISNALIRIDDVAASRTVVIPVVHQHDDVFLLEAPNVHDILLYIQAIVVASTQLSTLTNIVDTNQNSPLRAVAFGRNDVELLTDIHLFGRSQLRNLRETPAAKNLAHFTENLDKRQI